MTNEKAADLLRRAKVVSERFRAGYHPSLEQLEYLERAIENCERMKLCGHLEDEECSCFEEGQTRYAK